jgi:hypothetical protein
MSLLRGSILAVFFAGVLTSEVAAQTISVTAPITPPTSKGASRWSPSSWRMGTPFPSGGGATGSGRVTLTADTTYYVNASGSDSNACTFASPCQTPLHVYQMLRDGYDLAGHKVTVQLQSNYTLTSTVAFSGRIPGQVHSDDFEIFGADTNWTDPGIYTISSTTPGVALFQADSGARFSVRGVTLRSSGTSGFGIVASEGSVITKNIWCGAMGGACLDGAGNGAIITALGDFVLLFENTKAAAIAEDHAQINLPCTITVSGAPSFELAFVQADLGGMIDASGSTVRPGGAMGVRFNAISAGIVFTGGTRDPNYFPGNARGNAPDGYYD